MLGIGGVEVQLKGIIFDMDGVLCDSEPFICEAGVCMFKEQHGVTVSASDFIPFVGAGENRYLGGVAEKHGVELALEADKAYTYAKYLELIKGRLQPLEGVKEFTAWCAGRGLKMAVATSADKVKLDGNLQEIGLDHGVFDTLVNGLEVEHKKPAPDIFIEAASRLGLPPTDCMVIEDAPNGVQAAKSASCSCSGITSSFSVDELKDAGADYVIDRLLELESILEEN